MSGIYIPNVEEPKTCCYCKMMVCDPEVKWRDGDKDRVGGMICLWTGELIHNTAREEHCPLIFVPDHGRLIDADILPEFDGYALSADAIAEAVVTAPTVIPADKEDWG